MRVPVQHLQRADLGPRIGSLGRGISFRVLCRLLRGRRELRYVAVVRWRRRTRAARWLRSDGGVLDRRRRRRPARVCAGVGIIFFARAAAGGDRELH